MTKLYLLIKSDSSLAEIYLFDGQEEIASYNWQAGRELSETLLINIKELLHNNNFDWQDLKGVGCYSGPGSFTGLRISHAVANSLAYGLGVQVASANGKSWQNYVCRKLIGGQGTSVVTPEYGRPARITKPKK